jgi:predicted CXXCH cytochrome family protein
MRRSGGAGEPFDSAQGRLGSRGETGFRGARIDPARVTANNSIGRLLSISVMAIVFTLVACTTEEKESTEPSDARALAVEGYTGAAVCQECHQEEHDLWSHTAHARAMTPATPEFVRGDFETDTTHTYDGQTYHMVRRGDSYAIRTVGPGGKVGTFPVVYTLGARQHETYLTRFPDGRIQVLPVYWDLIENRWYDAAEGTLEFGRAFTPNDRLFWANQGRTWNDRCFDCHASQMRKNYDFATNTYDTALGDLSINCETCHGPGEQHTTFWRKALVDPELAAQGEKSLVRATSLSPSKQVEICAQCHATKTVLRSGFKPGDDFLDFYELNLIDDADSFWPDGLVRKLAYPHLQFAGSQCFQKADLTCTGCHANHGSDMPVELIAEPAGGALCARCHPDVTSNISAHTFHKLVGKGSDCKACHMPEMFLNYLTVTDHRLTVPVPDVTTRLGVPNACNQAGCHSDQSSEWASEKAVAWWGGYQDERANRTQAIQWGREGDARGLRELTRIVDDPAEDPLLRGGAVTLIGRIGDVSALPTLLAALDDTHQVVRSRATVAVGAIGHPVAIPRLKKLVQDPVYGVRIRAAFSLAKLEYVPPTGPDRLALEKALSEHEASSFGILADSPNTHTTIGQAHEALGQFKAAEVAYRRALRVSPGHRSALERMELMDLARIKYDRLLTMVTPHLEKDVRLKVALGIAKIHQGLIKEGVGILHEVKSTNMYSELLETGLGDGYRKAGDLVSAQKHYERAIEIYARHANAYRGLALVAFSRGEQDKGSQYWSQFEQYADSAGKPSGKGLF